MALHDHVSVIVNGKRTRIRASIISRYLPDLWRRYTREYPRNTPLQPVNYLRQSYPDKCTRLVLRYLFRYLQAIENTTRECTLLQEYLDNAWVVCGPRRGKDIFFSLGHILLPQNFGCHKDIWLTIQMFVINHSNEILEFDWVEYIKLLDEIDASNQCSLKEALWCFTLLTPVYSQDLHERHLIRSLGPRLLKILSQHIRRRDRNIHQFLMGFGCINCYYLAHYKVAWDIDRRRESYLPWVEYFDSDIGMANECQYCSRVFRPIYNRHRRALARKRAAGSPHHAAHHDNYETEISPWGFNGVRQNIPRFMQPFPHNVRYGRWDPRLPRWEDVMT